MLALANTQQQQHHHHHHHHSSRHHSQEWRAKEEKNMRSHNTPQRPHSQSVSGLSSASSSSPSVPRRQRSHLPRRPSTLEPSDAPTLSNNGSNSPPLPGGLSERSNPAISPASIQTHTPPSSPPQLDIANYPSPELLKLLAALLQQIASANDALRSSTPAGPLHASSERTSTSNASHDSAASRSSVGNIGSPSSFHARNIPTISIESYLLRILKYCPTTNEVFLSLLVYFDRMSRASADPSSSAASGFAIDSYNVHRLVIAGVTVASKFFSDVFYLNSRYAKVRLAPDHHSLNQAGC